MISKSRIDQVKEKLLKCNHTLASFDADFHEVKLELLSLYKEFSEVELGEKNKILQDLLSVDLLKPLIGLSLRIAAIFNDKSITLAIAVFIEQAIFFNGVKMIEEITAAINKINQTHGPFSCGCEKCALHPSNISFKSNDKPVKSDINLN